jgi:very-short-patch-repair endonuclease
MKKGSHITLEQKKKISEAVKKTLANPEIKKKISDVSRKSWANPEYRKKFSEEHKGHIVSEETRKKISKAKKGKHHSEETKKKIGIKSIGRPEKYLKKYQIKKGNIPYNKGGGIISEETRRKMSESGRMRIGDKNSFYGKIHSPETRRRLKETRAKQILPTKDTKIEKKIQVFLKELGIGFILHKYVQIKHGYQCDIFIPNLNLVIECDGDYWHGNLNHPNVNVLNSRQRETTEKDKIRTQELIEKGFKVLRLWGSEIEKMDISEFKEKLGKV